MEPASQAWIDTIVDSQPRLLVTTTFRKTNNQLPVDYLLRETNKLVKHVNRTLFRKRYERGEDCLQGFAVLERQHNDQPHFHILVTNDLDAAIVTQAFQKHIPKFHFEITDITTQELTKLIDARKRGAPAWALKSRAKQHIRELPLFDSKHGIDVATIDQTDEDYERVARYLMKENSEFLLLDAGGLSLPEKERLRG